MYIYAKFKNYSFDYDNILIVLQNQPVKLHIQATGNLFIILR